MLVEKICLRCKGEPKPISEFSKDKTKKDGLQSWCKICRTKYQKIYNRTENGKISNRKSSKRYSVTEEGVKSKKKANRKYYNTEKGNKKIKERIKKYRMTKEGKETSIKSVKKYRKENPEKYKAQYLLNNAIVKNEIRKPMICSICKKGNEIIHGHHEDYSKPLDVIWCCAQCHSDIHNPFYYKQKQRKLCA